MNIFDLLYKEDPHKSIILAILKIDQSRDDPPYPRGWLPDLEGYIPGGIWFVDQCITKNSFRTEKLRSIKINDDVAELALEIGGANKKKYFYINDMLIDHPKLLHSHEDHTFICYSFLLPIRFVWLLKRINKRCDFRTVMEFLSHMPKDHIVNCKEYFYIVNTLNSVIFGKKKSPQKILPNP